MAEAEGIPPTASVASVGPGIRYAGNWVYALSGEFAALRSLQTLLDFTTGSGFIVASLTMTAPIHMDPYAIAGGYNRGFQLNFNAQTAGLYKVDGGGEDMPTALEVTILIPPFTDVVLTCIDTTNAPDFLGTANLTGRVYGAA